MISTRINARARGRTSPMYYNCFRCGQPGHFSAECPTREREAHPPEPPAEGRAPDPPYYKPPPPRREAWQVSDPTPDYLLAKTTLGFPETSMWGRLVSVPCPWCGTGKGIPCINRATGARKQVMHEARYATALVPLPPIAAS